MLSVGWEVKYALVGQSPSAQRQRSRHRSTVRVVVPLQMAEFMKDDRQQVVATVRGRTGWSYQRAINKQRELTVIVGCRVDEPTITIAVSVQRDDSISGITKFSLRQIYNLNFNITGISVPRQRFKTCLSQ